MSDMSNSALNETGFTLIEALIALVLGVSVISVVVSTLRMASDGATRAVAVAAETDAFARVGSVLAGDALHALKLRDTRDEVIFVGQSLAISFPATPHLAMAAPMLLRYDLLPVAKGTDLVRSEAVLLAEGVPGPNSPGQTIWHGTGKWEFRYLDHSSNWSSNWTGDGLPRAFGLVELNAPQTVELVGAFSQIVEPECALGPGPKCSLMDEVVP